MVEMIDMSGQPRSDEELQEAINVCKQIMVKQSLVLPLFTLHAGTIVNCLEELQVMRRLLAEAKRKRLEEQKKGGEQPWHKWYGVTPARRLSGLMTNSRQWASAVPVIC